MSAQSEDSSWTKVGNKQRQGRNNSNNSSKPGTAKKGNDTGKKFSGHDKAELEGIVLTEDGNITQFTELLERLQTVGGSKYIPKVGVSIETLKRFKRADFAPTKPTSDEWTTIETNEEGETKEVIDEELKEVLIDMYKEELKQSVKDLTTYTKDMNKVYALALGQIDDGMKEKLKSNDRWEVIKKNRCPVELLKLLRDICFQGSKTKIHTPTNLARSLRKLLCSRQRSGDCTAYVQGVIQFSEVLETIGGEYICPALIKHELETNTKYRDEEEITYADYLAMAHDDKTKKRINHTAFQQFIAAIIIEGSDEETSTLKQTLANQYTLGTDQYPTTTTQALDMLNQFKGTKKPKPKGNNNNSNGKSRRQNTTKSDSGDPLGNENNPEGKEATTFVNKGVSQNQETANRQDGKQHTARQVLMHAVANDSDFGHEMDNYFQMCTANTSRVQDQTSHCHVQWSHTDNYESSDEDDAESYDSENNEQSLETQGASDEDSCEYKNSSGDKDWDYWAAHDEQEEALLNAHSAGVKSLPNTLHGSNSPDASSYIDVASCDSHDTQPETEECTVLIETDHMQQADRPMRMAPSVLNNITLIRDVSELNHKGRYGKSVTALDLAYSDYQAIRYGVVTCFRYSHNVQRLLVQSEGQINENWILLDSESSCNLITNPNLVTNIRKAPNGNNMSIYCNSRKAYTDQIADLPGFGEVWFYPDRIASVLSLALISDRYRVTMDTSVDNAMHVHKDDGSTERFGRSPCNLYYYDVTNKDSTVLTIMTVKGNKEQYSDLDVRRADKARKLQETVGFPTSKDLIRMLDNKLVVNSSVTSRDVFNAEAIYGKHSSVVKGKQVRNTGEHMREDLTVVPYSVLDNYRDTTIHMDIMTVNGIRFLHTISRHLKFRTARAITNANSSTILDCIKSVCGQYRSRGFIVTQVLGDNQFECVRDDLIQLDPPVQLHCVGAGQHEPTVERSIRTVQENVRCYFNHIPFRKLPKRCTIELVYAVVFWLNCRTTGVCKSMCARELITGIPLDAKECKFQFMEPILAHVDDTDNTMAPRAVEALYLRPTGSLTGGFWAYDMNTGKRIHRRSATPTPLTEGMVKQIEAIASEQQCLSGIMFGDGKGDTTILDLDTAENMDDDDASDASYRDVEESDDDSIGSVDSTAIEVDGAEGSIANTHGYDGNNLTEHNADAPNDANGIDNGVDQLDPVVEDNETADNEGVDDNEEHPEEEPHAVPTHSPVSSRLRPTVTRTHNKFDAQDGYEPSTHSRSFFTAGYANAVKGLGRHHKGFMFVEKAIKQYNAVEASPVTPQYGVKKGIKLFGEAGVNAVLKELQQIHDRKVLSALDPKTMTKEMVQQALPYLMFLKRKRDTSIKGRGCADGRRQREYIRKEDATSPTVSLYALVLSCIIDAIEGRDVATVDIPGAFLQTDMPDGEDVYIRLDGTMAELLCRVNPKMYSKYILNRNGKKTLFTRAEKAIYGTLRAALLFWEKLYAQLCEWGFEMNPYDPCTVNKVIKGHQCTIVWHVDDLKISHRDPKVVTSVIQDLNSKFGVESPLTETRGKVHDYVGMTLDYSTPGKVMLHMFDYLEDVLQGLPDSLKGSAATPAGDHLFQVSEQATKLSEDDSAKFHHYVAKLLYMAKRTRPDIQTAIAFLCTQIAEPDEDNWKKLKCVMSYLRETSFLPLVLGWDETGNVYWHVDAAFAVHKDMRSHSGGVMTLGTGAAITTCTKQKLNTKSSTEAEVVGVDDNMTFILWARYFLEAQRQHMTDNGASINSKLTGLPKDNILYQDNESAIKLEKNGKSSSTKRTRHINIRYFFVTDRVKKGKVTIEYCPTEDIIADYFTKPLQGAKFRKFRNAIQGISEKDYTRYKQMYCNASALPSISHESNAAAATA